MQNQGPTPRASRAGARGNSASPSHAGAAAPVGRLERAAEDAARQAGPGRWLPRLQLVEVEDLPWWPALLRDLATDSLHFLQMRLALHRAIVPLLADAVERSGVPHLVDLCSGGGGPVPAIVAELRKQGLEVSAVLTDRFPNREAFARAAAGSAGAIGFEEEPVDARAVPPRLRGFRTLFNAFHHFPPAIAVAVLRAAQQAGQPIGVFEIPDRRPAALAQMLLTPLLVWLAGPFMRPFSWRRLLWTCVIPLVPLVCAWDGIVSQLRAYRPGELETLAAQAGAGYRWRAGRVATGRLPIHVTYLIGVPEEPR